MIKRTLLLAGLLLPVMLAGRRLPECVSTGDAGLLFPGDRSAQDLFYAKLDSLIDRKSVV